MRVRIELEDKDLAALKQLLAGRVRMLAEDMVESDLDLIHDAERIGHVARLLSLLKGGVFDPDAEQAARGHALDLQELADACARCFGGGGGTLDEVKQSVERASECLVRIFQAGPPHADALALWMRQVARHGIDAAEPRPGDAPERDPGVFVDLDDWIAMLDALGYGPDSDPEHEEVVSLLMAKATNQRALCGMLSHTASSLTDAVDAVQEVRSRLASATFGPHVAGRTLLELVANVEETIRKLREHYHPPVEGQRV